MTPRILITTLFATLLAASSAQAMIFVKIPNLGDECRVEARDESTLTRDLEVAARGARPGRLELRVVCGSRTSAELSRLAGTRHALSALGVEFRESQKQVCYLKYKLDRCFIKSWSTSGDADAPPTGGAGTLVLEYDKATTEPLP